MPVLSSTSSLESQQIGLKFAGVQPIECQIQSSFYSKTFQTLNKQRQLQASFSITALRQREASSTWRDHTLENLNACSRLIQELQLLFKENEEQKILETSWHMGKTLGVMWKDNVLLNFNVCKLNAS